MRCFPFSKLMGMSRTFSILFVFWFRVRSSNSKFRELHWECLAELMNVAAIDFEPINQIWHFAFSDWHTLTIRLKPFLATLSESPFFSWFQAGGYSNGYCTILYPEFGLGNFQVPLVVEEERLGIRCTQLNGNAQHLDKQVNEVTSVRCWSVNL